MKDSILEILRWLFPPGRKRIIRITVCVAVLTMVFFMARGPGGGDPVASGADNPSPTPDRGIEDQNSSTPYLAEPTTGEDPESTGDEPSEPSEPSNRVQGEGEFQGNELGADADIHDPRGVINQDESGDLIPPYPEELVSGRSNGMEAIVAQWIGASWGTPAEVTGTLYTIGVEDIVAPQTYWDSPSGTITRAIARERPEIEEGVSEAPEAPENVPTAAVLEGMRIVSGPPIGTTADVKGYELPSGVASNSAVEVLVRYTVGNRYGDGSAGEDSTRLYGNVQMMEQRVVVIEGEQILWLVSWASAPERVG